VPFRDALRASPTALAHAVAVADEAARATADLVPRKGRAKTHAARSLGSPDPGAVSLVLVLRAAADSIKEGVR
jgi:dihydroxyacetone kinase